MLTEKSHLILSKSKTILTMTSMTKPKGSSVATHSQTTMKTEPTWDCLTNTNLYPRLNESWTRNQPKPTRETGDGHGKP